MTSNFVNTGNSLTGVYNCQLTEFFIVFLQTEVRFLELAKFTVQTHRKTVLSFVLETLLIKF